LFLLGAKWRQAIRASGQQKSPTLFTAPGSFDCFGNPELLDHLDQVISANQKHGNSDNHRNEKGRHCCLIH